MCRFVLYLRRRLLTLLSTNPLAAAAIKDLCAKTPLFFIELFCLLPYIAELTPFSIQHQLYKHLTKKLQRSGKPAVPKASPFIPFRYLQSLIKTLVDRINSVNCYPVPGDCSEGSQPTNPQPPLMVQKSSSIGATSAVLLTYLWFFLFKPDSNFLIMTPCIPDLYLKELKNHARIPVFNFLQFVLNHLPEELKQNIRFHKNTKKYFYCYLENTTNGNKIIGLSSGTKRNINDLLYKINMEEQALQPQGPPRPPSGTSIEHTPTLIHTFKSIFLDDLAFHSHADYHYTQLTGLSNSIIAVSSPNGTNNIFSELCQRSHKDDLFILHWIMNPLYDRAWYDSLIKAASANYVEQYINLQFDHRYRSSTIQKKTKEESIHSFEETTSHHPELEQESKELSSREQESLNDTSNRLTCYPGSVPPESKSSNPQPPLENAAFLQENIDSTTPDKQKQKRPPILSALTGLKRKSSKLIKSITSTPFVRVKIYLSGNTIENCTLPAQKNYNCLSIIKGWRQLNLLVDNKANLFLESGNLAISAINIHSKQKLSSIIAPHTIADTISPIEFKALFYTEPSVSIHFNYLNLQKHSTCRQSEPFPGIIPDHGGINSKHNSTVSEDVTFKPLPVDMMESDCINHLVGMRSFTDPELLSIARYLLRDYTILKAEKRNRMAREDRERYPAIYEAMQKPRPKRDKYYPSSINWDVIFPDGYRSNRYPDIDYTPQPEVFKPSKENEEEQRHIRILHASWDHFFKRDDGRYYPRTIDWDVTFTSPGSPESKQNKHQNPSGSDRRELRGGSPSEVQGDHAPPLPKGINEQPNCPPEIDYCPLGDNSHIPCYPECPHGMIHNYNRYLREEEAKRIQEKEKSKKKSNKNKNVRKNKSRPPPA